LARIIHDTLEANTVATVTLSVGLQYVEVGNLGTDSVTDRIYVTVDGADPTVAGDDCYVVPANSAVDIDSPKSGNTVVKLISAGTPDYWVGRP
jgi:hypothetical protein